VHWLLPNALAAGVKVSTPAASTAGAFANSFVAAASHSTLKVTAWLLSPGPAEMLVAQAALYAPESSAMLMLLAVTLKLGGWFTANNGSTRSQLFE
jgi:hypothetical protein